MSDLQDLKMPQHVAIILDGNGRWAKKKGMPRNYGHVQGAKNVELICEAAYKMGIQYLTVYAFSTENWNRPAEEVAALMGLILTSLEEELFMKNNVRMRLIGDLTRVPEVVRRSILALQERTAVNTGMTMVIALSYSSRWELSHAVRCIAREVADGRIKPGDIDEEYISQNLATSFMPDPDLLIRTGGELRLSNYLLWQCAYSELYFCDTYWPDFHEDCFYKAILDYQNRERRFGKTSEQVEGQA